MLGELWIGIGGLASLKLILAVTTLPGSRGRRRGLLWDPFCCTFSADDAESVFSVEEGVRVRRGGRKCVEESLLSCIGVCKSVAFGEALLSGDGVLSCCLMSV